MKSIEFGLIVKASILVQNAPSECMEQRYLKMV
jgi:hypothetical protein